MPFWRAARLACVSTLGCLLLYQLPWKASLQRTLAHPVEFRIRHWLHRDPPIDPRLVIYGIGDSSLQYLGREEFSLRRWVEILRLLAQRKPRAILIDKIFGTPSEEDDAEAFVREIKALGFPVIAGGFATPNSIPGRSPLSLDSSEYRLDRYLASDSGKTGLDALNWFPIEQGYAYGPHPRVREAFRVGHLLYGGDDSYLPFVRLTRENAIPGAPLLVAKQLQWRGPRLFADGNPIPLNDEGRILVDLQHPSIYFSKTHALYGLFERLREGRPAPVLPPDAVVVILPAVYTGHGDFAQTPFGSVSGGYLVASLANSVLTGHWLTVASWGWICLLLSGVWGGASGLLFPPLAFGIIFFSSLALLVATAMFSFTFLSVELPWIFSMLTFSISALVVFTEKMRREDDRVRHLQDALIGTFPPGHLKEILERARPFSPEPAGRLISIMFIDIVGFSLAAELQSPRDAFVNLKKRLALLTERVHEAGGVVDKMLGDGLLSYFGYHFDGSESEDHADRALECAVRIQRENVQRNLEAQKNKEPVYPLRIGINIASVYVGDLGNNRKLDLTVIGQGVNFAKRLESAADSDNILIGAGTRKALMRPLPPGTTLKARYIHVKNFPDLVEAYECDPLEAEPDLKAKSALAYRTFLERDRKEKRWPLPPGQILLVSGTWGKGQLLNFSESGLAFQCDHYFGRGVHLNVNLDSSSGALGDRLRGLGLMPLLCEVRWGRAAGPELFQLGVVIQSLDRERRGVLLVELKRAIEERTIKAKDAA